MRSPSDEVLSGACLSLRGRCTNWICDEVFSGACLSVEGWMISGTCLSLRGRSTNSNPPFVLGVAVLLDILCMLSPDSGWSFNIQVGAKRIQNVSWVISGGWCSMLNADETVMKFYGLHILLSWSWMENAIKLAMITSFNFLKIAEVSLQNGARIEIYEIQECSIFIWYLYRAALRHKSYEASSSPCWRFACFYQWSLLWLDLVRTYTLEQR